MDLSFVRPPFLWGLLFLAVPVIIHLLDRKKLRALDFSTTRFFGEEAVRTHRRRRLQSFLLLLTRLAMIAALVVLFAQPYRTKDPFNRLGDPRATFLCWIDPTVSMEYRAQGRPLHEEARNLIDSLNAQIPSGASVRLFSESQGAFEELTGSAPFSVRHGPADIAEMLSALPRAARGTLPVVVVLSDFQEVCARSVPATLDTFLSRVILDMPVLIGSLAPPDPWNFSITDVSAAGGSDHALSVTVRADGRDLQDGKLRITCGQIRSGEVAVHVARGDSFVIETAISRDLRGDPATVRLEVNDPFPADNVSWCEPGRGKAMRVLVIGDSATSYPITAALGSIGATVWRTAVRWPDRVQLADIDTAEVVVAAGLGEAPAALRSYLRAHRASRKAIVVSPALDPSATLSGLLGPGSPPRPAMVDRAGTPVLPDTISALWQGFPGMRDDHAAVRRYLRPLPGETVLPLDNGDALAARLVDGQGNVWIFFSTPVHLDSANSLWHSGLYVPLLDRLIRSALTGAAGQSSRWLAGIVRPNPCADASPACDIYREDGSIAGRWGGQQQVVLDKPGLYRLEPVAAASRWITAVVDPCECSFVYRAPSVPPRQARWVKVMDAREIPSLVRRKRSGLSADWLWAVVGLLVLAEMGLWGGWRGRGKLPRTGLRV